MGATADDDACDQYLDIFKTNFSEDTSLLHYTVGRSISGDVSFGDGLGFKARYLGWAAAPSISKESI